MGRSAPTRRRTLFIAALVAAATLVIAVPATPATPTGAWRGTGEITIDNGDSVLRRSVEAWLAADGRYRVVTTTLDKTAASEEVVYDGTTQTTYVTDPGGSTSAIKGVTTEHFAIPDTFDGTKAPTNTTEWLDITWKPVAYDAHDFAATSTPDTLSDTAPTPAPAEASPTNRFSGPFTGGLGGDQVKSVSCGTHNCSTTFTSIIDYTACVYAYNYRLYTNGYFRASSSTRGSCAYVSVSLWNGEENAFGCSALGFLVSGPTASGYSSEYFYTDPDDLSPTCSAHAGWLSDWSLVVPWPGLDTV